MPKKKNSESLLGVSQNMAFFEEVHGMTRLCVCSWSADTADVNEIGLYFAVTILLLFQLHERVVPRPLGMITTD